jgi:hypothetical protein
MVARSEIERVVFSNVQFNVGERKLEFDSNTFINLSKILEVKQTRRYFNTTYGKLVA